MPCDFDPSQDHHATYAKHKGQVQDLNHKGQVQSTKNLKTNQNKATDTS